MNPVVSGIQECLQIAAKVRRLMAQTEGVAAN